MPIFVSPQTLNNGADHIFTFRGQVIDPKIDGLSTEWVELAAMASDSKYFRRSQRRTKATRHRELEGFSILAPVNGDATKLDPIVVTHVVSFNKGHSEADVVAALTLSKAAQNVAGHQLKIYQGEV